MSQAAKLMIDKPDVFDDIARTHDPCCSEILFVTKREATINKAPAITVAFKALIRGEKVPVCATLSLEAFMQLEAILTQKYRN